MKVPPKWRSPITIHAARVAMVATVIIGVMYVCVVAGFDAVDRHRLVAQIDTRLDQRLADSLRQPSSAASIANYNNAHDVDDAPVFLWKVGPNGRATALTPGAPLLSSASWSPADRANESRLGAANFRLESRRTDDGWFVVGQSLAEVDHVESDQAEIAHVLLHQVGDVIVAHEQHVERHVLAVTHELILAPAEFQTAAGKQIERVVGQPAALLNRDLEAHGDALQAPRSTGARGAAAARGPEARVAGARAA